MTGPDADREPYVPVRIAPDPARDARVAARRADDARRAGAALDKLLAGVPAPTAMRDAYSEGWSDGYAAAGLQHNRHYGVAPDACLNRRFPEHGRTSACVLCGYVRCSLAGDGEHDCADPTSEGSCRP